MRTLFVLVFTAFSIGVAAQAQKRVTPVAREMPDFHTRVEAYMDVRERATKDLPDVTETGDPAKIRGREKALGQAIAKARAGAKPGDVFGAEMSVYLKRTLAEDWKSRSAADRKALFEEVPKGISLTINQPYPTTLPLVSAPAELLARLPMLPEALEYRLVDRLFLLRDRDANLIVDVLPNVYPARDK